MLKIAIYYENPVGTYFPGIFQFYSTRLIYKKTSFFKVNLLIYLHTLPHKKCFKQLIKKKTLERKGLSANNAIKIMVFLTVPKILHFLRKLIILTWLNNIS